MTTALLIIDVQEALCSGDRPAFDAKGVIGRINLVSAKARSAKVPVVVIQHETAEGRFVHGSPGWQLAAGLQVAPSDLYVRKRATDSFHETRLKDLLDQQGVDRLVVCGMQSEFCVDTTIRRALALGYPVSLVSDAHTTLDNGVLSAAQISAHHNETLANLISFGPRVALVPAGDLTFQA